jgi:midasin
MNPGGDYGKKELSPALRNRFTEIWVPPVHEQGDLELFIASSWEHPVFHPYATRVLDFVDWLVDQIGDRSRMTRRDLLVRVFSFPRTATYALARLGLTSQILYLVKWHSILCPSMTYLWVSRSHCTNMTHPSIQRHAACMTVLDGLGSLPQAASYSPQALLHRQSEAFSKLRELAPHGDAESPLISPPIEGMDHVEFGPFRMTKGDSHAVPTDFYFHAPTTLRNAARVARACQLPKAILLEGSPGVCKTSLITALAKICGHTGFNKLGELISLSSGSGVTEIWSTFSDEGRTFPLSTEMNRLDILLCNARPSNDQYSQTFFIVSD